MRITMTLEGRKVVVTTEHRASSSSRPVVLIDGVLTDIPVEYEPGGPQEDDIDTDRTIGQLLAQSLKRTGYADGPPFTSEEEVRSYFTEANMIAKFGECDLSQNALDTLAARVIATRDHCEFPPE